MSWLFALFLLTSDIANIWLAHLIASEKKSTFGCESGKNVNFQLIGDDFFTITISKIMAPLKFPRFFLNFGNIPPTFWQSNPGLASLENSKVSVKSTQYKKLQQMLCGSQIRIWNHANHMKNKTKTSKC